MIDQEKKLSPFDALGIESRFDVDPMAVERAYLKRAAALHPDRTDDPPSAADHMATLNEARLTLLDPERRAHALVRLRLGGRSLEEKLLPEGFLPHIFAVRQEMEEELLDGNEECRARFRAWADEQREHFMGTVSELFAELPADAHDQDFRPILVQLNAWRYIERMIDQLDPAYSRPEL